MKTPKKILIACLFFISCNKEEQSTDHFLCTVDYVEFVDISNVIVKFETTYKGVTRPYFGKYTYLKENNNYYIGDQMVSILNFSQQENEATFIFSYGENLGYFCATLFETLPEHIHFTFDAEAEKVISGKSVGKWKIKKKTTLKSIDKQ